MDTSRSGSGSATTELRQVELPAISLTGPGSVTPAPRAHARLSAAPAITGTVWASPNRRTRAGRSSPATVHEACGTGSRAGSRPSQARRSVAQVRRAISNMAVAPASVQSVTGSPVRASPTYSDGCTKRLAASKMAGSCARIQPILAAVKNAVGTWPVRACRPASPNCSRSARDSAVARLSR